METPEVIYLIPQDLDEEDAVKYIRADLVKQPPNKPFESIKEGDST